MSHAWGRHRKKGFNCAWAQRHRTARRANTAELRTGSTRFWQKNCDVCHTISTHKYATRLQSILKWSSIIAIIWLHIWPRLPAMWCSILTDIASTPFKVVKCNSGNFAGHFAAQSLHATWHKMRGRISLNESLEKPETLLEESSRHELVYHYSGRYWLMTYCDLSRNNYDILNKKIPKACHSEFGNRALTVTQAKSAILCDQTITWWIMTS